MGLNRGTLYIDGRKNNNIKNVFDCAVAPSSTHKK